MGLLKRASPAPATAYPLTKETVELQGVCLTLPPLARWRRAEIEEAELGNAHDRDGRAKQRALELARCDSEDRLDLSRRHEKEDRAMRDAIAWASSATGRFFDSVTNDDENEQPHNSPGRVRTYCPACQRDHSRRNERNAKAKAAWIERMDPEERALLRAMDLAFETHGDRRGTIESLNAWRLANPTRVTPPPDEDDGADAPEPALVIEHRHGQATGAENRLACVAGCGADAIAHAASELISDHERTANREHAAKTNAIIAAELTPATVVAPTWALPDLVPASALTIMNGATGTMKTWLAEAMALAIATNTPLFGRRPSKPGRVLLVLAEAYRLNLVRLEPLARGMGAPIEAGNVDIWPHGVPFKTHEPSTMQKLASYVRTRNYAAIAIDNLTEIRGGTSQNAENDATVMSNALRPLAQLAHDGTIDGVRVTNRPPAIVVLHHDRGSTAIGQHADYVLRLSRGSQAPEAPVTIKLGEGCRLASAGLPITVRFVGMAPNAITPELVVRRDSASEPEPAEELSDRQRAIIAALREQPGQSVNSILRAAGGSKRDIGPTLRALEARGYAELRDGQWFAVDEE